jgi:hypothetical protein
LNLAEKENNFYTFLFKSKSAINHNQGIYRKYYSLEFAGGKIFPEPGPHGALHIRAAAAAGGANPDAGGGDNGGGGGANHCVGAGGGPHSSGGGGRDDGGGGTHADGTKRALQRVQSPLCHL